MNLLGDKALEEPVPEEAAAPEGEAPVESPIGDEVDLEAALGGGIRKAPAAVAALLEEADVAEGGD